MGRFSGLLSVFLAVLTGLAATGQEITPTFAQEAAPTSSNVVLPPDAKVEGLGLAEWSTRSWQWFFSLSAESNPYFDATGETCGYGQVGPVFFLAGAQDSVERSCVIPEGVHLFVPLLGSECSTVESPPFFGRDEDELRRCATAAVDMAESAFDLASMRLTVDGQIVDNFSAYRTVTPMFHLWLPKENLLGSQQRVADSVADGYQVLLRPLSLGDHQVVIDNPGPRPEDTVTITYNLTVVSGNSGEPTAAPGATPTL